MNHIASIFATPPAAMICDSASTPFPLFGDQTSSAVVDYATREEFTDWGAAPANRREVAHDRSRDFRGAAAMLEFEVGQVSLFEYPVHNAFGLPIEYRWRKILVTDIRELDLEPLSTVAVTQRPLVRRGNTLIYGIDKETGEERKFYTAAMKRGRPTALRIVLLDAEEPDDSPEPVGRLFMPTAEDRRTMVETLEQLKAKCDFPENFYFAVQAVEVSR